MTGRDYVIIDLETEMIGDYGDVYPRILEIGVLRVSNDLREVRSRNSTYVDPERPLLPRPEQYTLRGYAACRGLPKVGQALQNLSTICSEAIPVAWQTSFERTVIQLECERVGRKQVPFHRRMLCAASLAGWYLRDQIDFVDLSLKKAVLMLVKSELVQTHKAIDDCDMTLEVMRAVRSKE